MKIIVRLLGAFCVILCMGLFSSCEKSNPPGPVNPFSNGGSERNMIVVMSDLHLGADTSYTECKKNLAPLVKLLKQIQASTNVKELVIGGDLVDEWFVPAPIDTYGGKDQADFVQRLATSNKVVIDAFNSIIQEGKILVTYVPGNHDMAITAASIESILPGISQARDNVPGLGTYSPAGCPVVAIEHGHRYDFFCAPDPFSNQDIAPGTILPPGYFYARIGSLFAIQKNPKAADTLPVVTPNPSWNESQNLLYKYWTTWKGSVDMFPIPYRFDDKFIVTNINGFIGNYSVDDVVPFQLSPGGFIDVALYHGILEKWDARQTHNNVPVHIKTGLAIDSVVSATFADHQASVQYFMNTASGKRIVIFGHTHQPRMVAGTGSKGEKCIYANSGTWIDYNPDQTTMNFVVITPQNTVASSQTFVKLYNFENEVVTEMDENSIRY